MDIFHEMAHEFEKPICIVLSFPRVGQAFEEIQKLEKDMKAEALEIQKKYEPLLEAAAKGLVETVKNEGLWPYDFNEETDHLMLKNGVLFYARHPTPT